MAIDMQRFRSAFPVTERLLFLNHASEAPVSRPVRQRIDEYMDVAMYDPDAAPIQMDRVRGLLARLLGGDPQEYALLPNTSTGISIAALGLDWQPGDNVVLPAQEFPANMYPWLALRDRGVTVRVVPLAPGLRVDPQAMAAHVDSRTRVVAVSAVEYLSGFRCDLKAIGHMARQVGALFVVDGIQACGAVPVNVVEDGIDLLAAGGFKWLLGPAGTGFAYIRRSVWDRIRPPLPGAMASVGGPEDAGGQFELLGTAQRYQNGVLPFSLHHGWTAGLEMLLEAGIDPVHQHLIALTDRLIAGLRTRGMKILSPVDRVAERSGIVVFTTGDREANSLLVRRLHEQGIVIAFRGGGCRVSPHFYNDEADIDRLLEAL